MIEPLLGWKSKGTLGLLATTLLVGALPAGVAGADQIAYTCEVDICLINPDNTEEHTNLTKTAPAEERSPSWSPDGKLIAFIGDYLGSWDVFTLDPTKTAEEQEAVAISETPDRQADLATPAAWSPDGTRIAFSERFNGNAPPNLESEVYVAPSDGSADPITIDSTSNKSEFNPTWSPDNSTLVFSRDGFLWKGPGDGSAKPTVLANSSGYEPAWSPDGQHIATVTPSDPEHIRITNADGSGFHELPPFAVEGPIDWSPDSSKVTYVADEPEGSIDQVRVVPADGSGDGNAVALPSGWIVPHNPTFSPDGTRVAFDARPEGGAEYEQVLVGPANGSAPAVPLTESSENNEEPDWKPCEGCAPATKPPAPPGGNGGPQAGTKTPTKIRLVLYKQVYVINKYMTPVSIDCNAEGGHPTGRVAEICAGSGEATYVQTRTATPSAAKKVVFATGRVKVPLGTKKPLKMKVSAAGAKLLKSGKTLSVKLSVKVTRPVGRPQTLAKTIKVALAKKK